MSKSDRARPHWRGFLKRSWKADRLTSHRLLLARRVDQDTSTLTRTWGRPVAMARFDQSEVLSAHEPIRPFAVFVWPNQHEQPSPAASLRGAMFGARVLPGWRKAMANQNDKSGSPEGLCTNLSTAS